MTLRSELSKDWVKYLGQTVDNLNKRHVKSLGGVAPAEVNSFYDDVKIRAAQTSKNVSVYREPNYREQIESQKNYSSENKSPFQEGAYVYLDLKTSAFDKSYDMQMSIYLLLFLVRSSIVFFLEACTLLSVS